MKKLISIIVLVALAASLSGQGKKAKIPPTPLNPLKGFANITEVTGGPGLSVTDMPYSKFIAGLTTVNGYQINKYFIAGAGTGAAPTSQRSGMLLFKMVGSSAESAKLR